MDKNKNIYAHAPYTHTNWLKQSECKYIFTSSLEIHKILNQMTKEVTELRAYIFGTDRHTLTHTCTHTTPPYSVQKLAYLPHTYTVFSILTTESLLLDFMTGVPTSNFPN